MNSGVARSRWGTSTITGNQKWNRQLPTRGKQYGRRLGKTLPLFMANTTGTHTAVNSREKTRGGKPRCSTKNSWEPSPVKQEPGSEFDMSHQEGKRQKKIVAYTSAQATRLGADNKEGGGSKLHGGGNSLRRSKGLGQDGKKMTSDLHHFRKEKKGRDGVGGKEVRFLKPGQSEPGGNRCGAQRSRQAREKGKMRKRGGGGVWKQSDPTLLGNWAEHEVTPRHQTIQRKKKQGRRKGEEVNPCE